MDDDEEEDNYYDDDDDDDDSGNGGEESWCLLMHLLFLIVQNTVIGQKFWEYDYVFNTAITHWICDSFKGWQSDWKTEVILLFL